MQRAKASKTLQTTPATLGIKGKGRGKVCPICYSPVCMVFMRQGCMLSKLARNPEVFCLNLSDSTNVWEAESGRSPKRLFLRHKDKVLKKASEESCLVGPSHS